jgi:hypothetical protein
MIPRANDLFEIVGFVKENFPFYSMYIDHYTIHGEETVLYSRSNLFHLSAVVSIDRERLSSNSMKSWGRGPRSDCCRLGV